MKGVMLKVSLYMVSIGLGALCSPSAAAPIDPNVYKRTMAYAEKESLLVKINKAIAERTAALNEGKRLHVALAEATFGRGNRSDRDLLKARIQETKIRISKLSAQINDYRAHISLLEQLYGRL